MNDVFASIYELFNLYGPSLGKYLFGLSTSCVGYDPIGPYTMFGLVLIMSSLSISIIYYYVINHPRFNKWYHWLIIAILNLLINGGFAFYMTYTDLTIGNICKEIISQISVADCFWFAFTNAIWSLVFFIAFSFSIRWWSTNCSSTPIPQ